MSTSGMIDVKTIERRLADLLAFLFVLVIIIYAASGPLSETVRWLIETTTAGWEEMSRRDQRLALKEHWLGAGYKSFERNVLLPTGLILGLPIIFAFAVTFLTLHKARWLNGILTALTIATFLFWIVNLFAIDGGLLPGARPIDYVLFPIATALTLYLTWRFFGGFIVGFCVFWIIYFFVRGALPDWTGIFQGSESTFDQSLRAMVLNFWAQTGGMFGQPLQVVSGNVLILIVFGAVLMASGAGDLLMKIANRLTGGLTGGAAHAAVASSALFGTLSGAAISNVVSTGVMTIPVIKKSGFRPAFAGAVEAAASTGGQVMPPVMGVVAFFVAGQIGLEYRYIVVAAIVPALFFYLGIFLTVYFEARRLGIGPLPLAARPKLSGTEMIQCLVFILPLGTISYFLFSQPSVPKAGFYGFFVALVASLALFPSFRSFRRVYEAFVNAGRMASSIIIIVAAIGLIVGLIQVSGFSGRLSLLLAQLADGPLFSTLIIVALGSIVLGMGLPPGATYFIIVIALSSGIDAVGIAPLTLHLFVVFFAVISTVTPPVALAAFAAAPIAGADPMRTGFQAARLSLAGFLIPFVFVYHPAVLYKLQVLFTWFGEELPASKAMMDVSLVSWTDLGWIILAFSLSIWLLSSALTGFEKNRLGAVERALRALAGLAILLPDWQMAAPAFGIGIALIIGHRFLRSEPSPIDAGSP
ncbi:MAG: TRAP transporter fused permease subunit [Pseudomonadota bacterium]